ncbi:hypothetical protein P171DRAFT_517535 [Karstenula rhodostoma CBS 690.94]|uniref:Uncharacterized protein n=1 Tax=Karstenula rhodostoma CBS 690.94 TaxID=1392251 RepID=A0A9P4UH88_9PLEO|nr:hypothetical protein P171DRAFT_517535 [Karstenula rhodostoma CBS 690.94]
MTEAARAPASPPYEDFAWYLTTVFDHGYAYMPYHNDDNHTVSNIGSNWVKWCSLISTWCPFFTECASGTISSGDYYSTCLETDCRSETVYQNYRTQSPLFSNVFCYPGWIQRTYYKQRPTSWEPEDLLPWTTIASTTEATTNTPSTSIQPGTTTLILTIATTASPTPPTPDTNVIVVPTLPPPSETLPLPSIETSHDTANAKTASSSLLSTPSSSPTHPPSLLSSPGFAPPTAYKPATEFVVGVSVGGTVFLCAIALVSVIVIRKRRNGALRKKEENQERVDQPQPPQVDLVAKPAGPELPELDPVVMRSELP